ncbi:uncharacterized protein LOC142937807 [Anarhichas minor]|uniref:uncharacterized protein LOC142937807 n=1 Tax=Anarhichas minor TaxID=65739 RepID=UPI003F737CDE
MFVVKLAADETKGLSEEEGEASGEQAKGGPDGPAGRESPGMVRVELEWSPTRPTNRSPSWTRRWPIWASKSESALSVRGSQEAIFCLITCVCVSRSEVKERVVWVDTKKTQIKNRKGKLKEKEITILEVRVKAQKPGEKQLQEVLYSTEAHTDRSFCRTGMNIVPWKHICTGLSGSSLNQSTQCLTPFFFFLMHPMLLFLPALRVSGVILFIDACVSS